VKRLILLVLVLQAVLIPVSVFANRGRARTMVDRLKREYERNEHLAPERLEASQRNYETQVLRTMKRKLRIPSNELNIDILREYIGKVSKQGTVNSEALVDLLQSITARGNVTPAQQQATANLLAQAIRLTKDGKLALEPRDILEVDRNWTVNEKDSLADVVLEAVALQKENPSLSSNKAFEQALENRGLKELFEQKCK
jgi:hypothetical protein